MKSQGKVTYWDGQVGKIVDNNNKVFSFFKGHLPTQDDDDYEVEIGEEVIFEAKNRLIMSIDFLPTKIIQPEKNRPLKPLNENSDVDTKGIDRDWFGDFANLYDMFVAREFNNRKEILAEIEGTLSQKKEVILGKFTVSWGRLVVALNIGQDDIADMNQAIYLAHCKGKITDEEKDTLHKIRLIRNRIQHSKTESALEHEKADLGSDDLNQSIALLQGGFGKIWTNELNIRQGLGKPVIYQEFISWSNNEGVKLFK